MKDLYLFLEREFKGNQKIEIYFDEYDNRIDYHLMDDENFNYTIYMNNEDFFIHQMKSEKLLEYEKEYGIDSDEDEGDIFKINYYHFEENFDLIYQMIKIFIDKEIEYFN